MMNQAGDDLYQIFPQLNLFAPRQEIWQPAIEFLSNNFDLILHRGLRLNWNISRFYLLKEKRLLIVNQRAVDLQEETFLLNTKLL